MFVGTVLICSISPELGGLDLAEVKQLHVADGLGLPADPFCVHDKLKEEHDPTPRALDGNWSCAVSAVSTGSE